MSGDLHCHTKLSDGSAAIEEVIFMARRLGIGTIAITDHDTQAGSTRAALIGERYGVNVIPGVELSAYDYTRSRKVHILCYAPDTPNRLEGICKQTLDRRRAANMKAASAVIRHYPINSDMIIKRSAGSTCLYKQHIMHTLVDSGCSGSIFGRVYDHLFNQGGIACEKIEYPDVFDVLNLVQDAGGIAVLAHPAVYDSFDLIPELIEKKLDGIEVWHPYQSEEVSDKLLKIAEKYGILKTGGSDFHGMYNSKAYPLGKALTPDDTLQEFLDYKAKRRKQFGY